MTLLEVADLRVEFDTYGGTVQAVRGVSFSLERGKTLAIVGESGCGKSVTVQSIMGLIPMPPGRITSGTAKLNGKDVLRHQKIDGTAGTARPKRREAGAGRTAAKWPSGPCSARRHEARG